MTEMGIIEGGAEVNKGENARMEAFVGAIAMADLVKTTLGPKGMDKILQSMGAGGAPERVVVTNDGATILSNVEVQNAAAKVLVDISKTQDDEVGDGTTSVVVLAGELLREAEKLVGQAIHPQIIVDGWRIAAKAAKDALEASANDHSADAAAFREDLIKIAKTSLSSKVLVHDRDHFAEVAVDAVLRLKGSGNLDSIQIIKKKGGALKNSYLEEGFILDKKMGVGQPRRMENAKILVANTPMDTDKVKIYGSRVKVDSMTKVAAIEEAEKRKMKKKVDKIIEHGINVFINRQLIYNYPEQLFTAAGVMAIEHADFDGVERLAAVTGGEIVSTFDHPELVTVGKCKLVEEVMIGEDKVLRFSGVEAGEACTIVLRGASDHLLDEAERSLHDALCVLQQSVIETRVTYGGGCAEMIMAKAVDAQVPRTAGKRALAIEAFARALRQLPTIIADNAGYDATELVTQLRAAHHEGNSTACLNMNDGTVGDAAELGVVECLKLKQHVLTSASEAAEMILRVDDIVKCAPRPRDPGCAH